MSEAIKIDSVDQEGRFARFELIGWWDQARLQAAKVLVIGAGALGNEIVKNLALLGVGRIFLADLDVVENSNLSRSVLFRGEDCGQPKAEVAARSARQIYPDLLIQPFQGNVVYDLGLGVYRWADVILGGLDNREARVAINQAAGRTGKIWIDGAIERLEGVARVFDPAVGPCYECTMGKADWKMLEARRSCALLRRDELEQGKVPTTPTTASVIAAIQCQEAVKLLHGLEVLSGKGYVFDGLHHQSYVVDYTQKDDCPAHEVYEGIETLGDSVDSLTAGDLLARAQRDLGGGAVVELNQDLLAELYCAACDARQPLHASLGKVSEKTARCPRCGAHRAPTLFHTLDGTQPWLDRTLAQLGVPPWDILTARAGYETRHYEMGGDRAQVLGPLEA